MSSSWWFGGGDVSLSRSDGRAVSAQSAASWSSSSNIQPWWINVWWKEKLPVKSWTICKMYEYYSAERRIHSWMTRKYCAGIMFFVMNLTGSLLLDWRPIYVKLSSDCALKGFYVKKHWNGMCLQDYRLYCDVKAGILCEKHWCGIYSQVIFLLDSNHNFIFMPYV